MQERVAAARRSAKVGLARYVAVQLGQRFDPDSMFDVQIKRIHEYKRQLLNDPRDGGALQRHPRQSDHRLRPASRVPLATAASYTQAKLIIKLAVDVARVVNSDPMLRRGLLKVVFLPNHNVSLAELFRPSTFLKISRPRAWRSGTGNMKMALNRALNDRTLDGANVELPAASSARTISSSALRADVRGGSRARPRHRRERPHRRLAGVARGARRNRPPACFRTTTLATAAWSIR